MTDWSTCPAVERNPKKISGAWAFTETRVPIYALFENLESGATVSSCATVKILFDQGTPAPPEVLPIGQ